jgi:Fe-S oxidoreductase
MFLELRRRSVRKDRRILKAYKPLRLYEALGGSSALKGYFLPEGCHAVYFPGCALPGIRPEQTEKLFRYLQNKIPQLGLVLDCCGKPSHDLGDHEGFVEKNTRQLKRLKEAGVRQIITSCSSCLRVFRQYAPEIEISMAYTHLSELVQDPDSLQRLQGISTRNYTVHDPCTVRFDAALQKSIRQLISSVGGTVIDMDHSGARTLCCGEGGAVGFVANEKKQSWQKKRKDEAGSLEMVTYCAGCTISLSSHATWHILDLVFPAKNGNRPRLVKPPMTYINRYLFKRKMVRYFTQSAMTAIPATHSSEKRHHKS